jgi:membrane protein
LQTLARKGVGKNLDTLSKELRVDDLQLEAPLQTLLGLDWVGKLDEDVLRQGGRYVLLINPATTLLAPLGERLLLPNQPSTQKLWHKNQWSQMFVAEVL